MPIYISILFLAFIQNVSFSMVSRSRNRDSRAYHTICSVFSNGIWFMTMHQLVAADLTFYLAIPYIIGTVAGSLFGVEASIKIEKLIGAKA